MPRFLGNSATCWTLLHVLQKMIKELSDSLSRMDDKQGQSKEKKLQHTLQKHCYHCMPSFHPDLTARDSTLYLQLLD